MATRPRELSHHAAGQVRSACDLRRAAADITAEIDSMFDLMLEEVARSGWDAPSVTKSLDITQHLEAQRDNLLRDAKRLESIGVRV